MKSLTPSPHEGEDTKPRRAQRTAFVLLFACCASLCLPAAPSLAQAPKPAAPPAAADKGGPPSTSRRTLAVIVPADGQYFLRVLPSPDGTQQAQLPIEFMGPKATVTYDTSGIGKSPKLAIDDRKTGNTAIVPPAGRFADDTLELHKIDFEYVRFVQVQVTYDSKPVQAARVTLAASSKSRQTKIIDPISQGIATFEDIPAGKAQISITYGDNYTQIQDANVSIDHPGDRQIITASVSNKVPTLDVAAGATPVATAPAPAAPPPMPGIQPQPPAPQQGGGLTSMVGTLLSLVLVIGAIYLLYRWAQSGGMAATLKKAGIEVSGPAPQSDAGTPWNPNAPPPPVVSDASLCQFCGQKKDAAGNCACTLSGAAIATGPTSAAIPTQPRLVGTMGAYSGTIFPLNSNGSGITVGREATNAIALPNDTTVSRRHASIRVEGGNYLVTDEGSSNGVYVNGVLITGSQPLHPGDEVQIGNTRFRFEV